MYKMTELAKLIQNDLKLNACDIHIFKISRLWNYKIVNKDDYQYNKGIIVNGYSDYLHYDLKYIAKHTKKLYKSNAIELNQEKILKEKNLDLFTYTKLFEKHYKGFVSDKTLSKYLEVIRLIENDKLIIKSKSRYMQVKAVLNKFKEIGIELNYILPKWTKKEISREKKIKDKLLTINQLQQIINEFPKKKGNPTSKAKQLALACEISYYSALRLSEVLSLTKDNFEITDDGTIKISVIGKNNKHRIALLPKAYINKVMKFNRFTINISYIETTFKRTCDKLAIKVTFHSLRHSCISNWANAGVNPLIIQQLAGHSDFRTTQIYIHLNPSLEDNALTELGY